MRPALLCAAAVVEVNPDHLASDQIERALHARGSYMGFDTLRKCGLFKPFIQNELTDHIRYDPLSLTMSACLTRGGEMRVTINPVDLRCCLSRFATGVCVVTVATGRPSRPDGQLVHGGLPRPAARSRLDQPPCARPRPLRRPSVRSQHPRRRAGARRAALRRAIPIRTPCTGRTNESHPGWQERWPTFECLPWQIHDGGDHTLYLGEVVEFEYRNGSALGYAYSRFTTARATGSRDRTHLRLGGARCRHGQDRSTSKRSTSARSRSRSKASASPGTSPRSLSSGTSCGRTRELFDLQHDPALHDVMTYESPTTASGSACRSSSRQPSTTSSAGGDAMRVWAEYSLGNLGRTGDYCNERDHGDGGARRLVRPGRAGVRRERPPLLRARARERPPPDAHARPAAGEPLGRPVPAAKTRRWRRASSTATTTGS